MGGCRGSPSLGKGALKPHCFRPIFTGLDIFGNIEDGAPTSNLGPLRLMSVTCPSARHF